MFRGGSWTQTGLNPIYVRSGMCFGYSSERGCVEQNAPTCRDINH
jgi:hypothetical protein